MLRCVFRTQIDTNFETKRVAYDNTLVRPILLNNMVGTKSRVYIYRFGKGTEKGHWVAWQGKVNVPKVSYSRGIVLSLADRRKML